MSDDAVALLYDALQAFEATHKRGPTYPVHKTLRFDDPGIRDIYDWIGARAEGRGVRHALDAGCGVGDGAIRLAQKLSCRVTGISLSEREIAVARDAVRQLDLADRSEFRRGTFDDLPSAAYELVVAVESLKHSPDLATSLRSLVASLRPGGLLVIVEDLHAGDQRRAVARALRKDWELGELYSERDYVAILEAVGCSCRVVDLGYGMRPARPWTIAVKLACLRCAGPFVGARLGRVVQAFSGGLRLERLYADGEMAYKAFLCVKGEGASS